jgi:putative transposase
MNNKGMAKQKAQHLQKKTERQKPRKTYLFRLYPTHKQQDVLEEWLGLCCETYNAALDERKSAYRMAGVSLSYEHQCAELPGCKEVRPELGEVPSQVLQEAVKRMERAFEDFFRRVEKAEKPGYPRFRSRSRYDSLTFKQYGNSFHVLPANKKNKGTLVLSKLGHVKMVMHRVIKGRPKTALVKRSPTGKWYVSISVEMKEEEVQEKRLPACPEEVGIDVGLKSFAYLSTAEEIAHPRFFRAEEAGRVVVRVNPAYTTQTCSACGQRQPMPLSVRVYECSHCGLVLHRDHNGSLNILEEGLKAVGRHSRVIVRPKRRLVLCHARA